MLYPHFFRVKKTRGDVGKGGEKEGKWEAGEGEAGCKETGGKKERQRKRRKGGGGEKELGDG